MSQIITTTDLQKYLGTTLDAQRAVIVVDAVNDYVESETNRCWGETREVNEDYDFGGPTLWLRHQDVQAIDTIQVGYLGQTLQTIDSTGYRVNSRGRLTMGWLSSNSGSPYYNDYLHITYTYGVSDVPADLKEAALGIAVGLYNWAKAGGNEVASYSVGSYHVETVKAIRSGSTTPGGSTAYNNSAELHFEVIKKYKTRKI